MNCFKDINQDYFITHLPIQLDATCNGYQHIAMLGRNDKLSENFKLCESSIDDIPAEQLSKLLVRDKLPNSGNTLKFMIPDYIPPPPPPSGGSKSRLPEGGVNSGWNNYSWVISKKIIEK